MKLIFFAVFAACACFVNGQQTPSTESWADDQNTIDDENSTAEITSEDDDLDQKVEYYLKIYGQDTLGDTTETSTSANDEVILEDKHFKYWPQVVIIKPMENRPMPFSLGNLLPNAHMFGSPYGNPNVQGFTTKKVKIIRPTPSMQTVKTVKPSTFTTFSTTTHHSFSTHGPEKKVSTTPEVLPEPEAREHETDAEIAKNEAENTESEPEPETEASTESPEIEETAENSCATPSGGSGECISLFNCPVLLGLVNKKDRTSQDVDLLKKSQCGYQGTAPAVCCPKQTQTQTQKPQGNCYTPDGKVGQCISLYSCAHIANMLKPPVPSENIAYVQKSKCEGPEQYSVCCGPPPDRNHQTMEVPSGTCDAQMTAYPPDPRTECCGVDSRVGNKIVGGNATTVDQYPWLVMIEYVQGGVTKLLCGGVLISGKYVLTAGHCVAGQVLTIGKPKRVRLGEYNISHEGADCAPVEAGGEDCTEGVTRILIEKVIPHPQYNPISPLKRNDIALLRLQNVAPFTDFIRPICLPTKDLTEPSNIPTNFSLYAAGWGAVSDRKSYSEVKLHVELPYVNPDKCQPVYSFPGRSVQLWKAQMCAGGVTGKDSCKGDSGGPLMYENGRTYEVIGIVSFGPVPCGMDGVPGVYSKVYEYLDWIRSTIVP